jgi:hypothetical protein
MESCNFMLVQPQNDLHLGSRCCMIICTQLGAVGKSTLCCVLKLVLKYQNALSSTRSCRCWDVGISHTSLSKWKSRMTLKISHSLDSHTILHSLLLYIAKSILTIIPRSDGCKTDRFVLISAYFV